MKKKSRNYINSISVPSLQYENLTTKTKLKPIRIYKNKPKPLLNNLSQTNIQKTLNKNSISVSLFQDNEVNIVRNLNLDDKNNFCSKLLYKGTLEQNMLKEQKILKSSQYNKGTNFPQIKKISFSNILDSENKLNENKKITLKNMANIQFEKELYGNLKDIKGKLKDLKNRKYELYKYYESKTQQIKDINQEIESLQSDNGETFLGKIFDLKTALTISSRHESSSSKRYLEETPKQFRKNTTIKKIQDIKLSTNLLKINNLWGKSNYDEKIERIKMLYLARKENGEKKIEKKRQIKEIKEEMKDIDDELLEINKKSSALKIQENKIIEKLMRHYEELLFKGKDTRNEGLIWIIKSMWKLGQNVPMQFIPTFLDFNSIEFLFKLANKSIELENKKNLLNKNKKELMIKIHKLYFYNKNNIDIDNFSKKLMGGSKKRSSLLFKTNLIKKNKILKRSVTQTNIVKSYIHSSVDDEQRDQEMNTFKEISKLVENVNNNVEIEKMEGMDNIEKLQKNIREIENEIVELKNKEILRIFKEFIENDYKNKHQVSIDIVLAALLGEHTKNIEVNKYAKYKKEYADNLKNIRFYEHAKKNDSI